MDSIPSRLGRIVRKHRLAAGLSQEELAERSGLHRTYISLLERGLRNPSVGVLGRIGGVVGLPASRLLAEAEELPI